MLNFVHSMNFLYQIIVNVLLLNVVLIIFFLVLMLELFHLMIMIILILNVIDQQFVNVFLNDDFLLQQLLMLLLNYFYLIVQHGENVLIHPEKKKMEKNKKWEIIKFVETKAKFVRLLENFWVEQALINWYQFLKSNWLEFFSVLINNSSIFFAFILKFIKSTYLKWY